MKTEAYVYAGYHRETQKVYIGSRWANQKHNRTPEDDFGIHYFTSSRIVKPIFLEFDWQIIWRTPDGKKAHDMEQELIAENIKNGTLYNGYYRKGFYKFGPHSAEQREKMSDAHKTRGPISDETRAKLVAAWKTRGPMSAETKAKIGDAQKGKPKSKKPRQEAWSI